MRAGARAGWPVAVHAIGDLANREALDAFEETRDQWSPQGLRPRIEHAQLLAEEDIPRFAEIGVAASVQFSHAPSDRDIAERNWAGMTDGAYAYRSLLESGRRRRERLRRTDRGARPARRDPRRRPAHARRPRAVAPRAGGHGRAGDRGDDPHAGLARPRRTPAREALARLPRRPRRARPRPARDRARGTTGGRGRRDDGRRPLDAQSASLGLAELGQRAKELLSRPRRRARRTRRGSARSGSGCSRPAGRSR